jgi:hypothetical protein
VLKVEMKNRREERIWRPSGRWDDNVKIAFKETGCDDVKWIHRVGSSDELLRTQCAFGFNIRKIISLRIERMALLPDGCYFGGTAETHGTRLDSSDWLLSFNSAVSTA